MQLMLKPQDKTDYFQDTLLIVSIASQGVTNTQTSVAEPMVMLQPSPEWDTAGSTALPAAKGVQALTCSNILNCSLISCLCISQVPPRGIFEDPKSTFLLADFQHLPCPC